MEAKDREPYGDADRAHNGAGKQAHELDCGPDNCVLEAFTHLPECRGSRGLCARKSVQWRTAEGRMLAAKVLIYFFFTTESQRKS